MNAELEVDEDKRPLDVDEDKKMLNVDLCEAAEDVDEDKKMVEVDKDKKLLNMDVDVEEAKGRMIWSPPASHHSQRANTWAVTRTRMGQHSLSD